MYKRQGVQKNFDDFFEDCVKQIELSRLEGQRKLLLVKCEAQADPEKRRELLEQVGTCLLYTSIRK